MHCRGHVTVHFPACCSLTAAHSLPPCTYCCVLLQYNAVPVSQLSSKLMEDPHKVAKYCTFLKDRGTVSTTISKQLTSIRKVLAWRASVGGEASHHRELQEVIKWVDLFHEQVPNVAMPSRAKLQRSNLPKAKEVLALQKQVGRPPAR